jgi:hypothetical protein
MSDNRSSFLSLSGKDLQGCDGNSTTLLSQFNDHFLEQFFGFGFADCQFHAEPFSAQVGKTIKQGITASGVVHCPA